MVNLKKLIQSMINPCPSNFHLMSHLANSHYECGEDGTSCMLKFKPENDSDTYVRVLNKERSYTDAFSGCVYDFEFSNDKDAFKDPDDADWHRRRLKISDTGKVFYNDSFFKVRYAGGCGINDDNLGHYSSPDMHILYPDGYDVSIYPDSSVQPDTHLWPDADAAAEVVETVDAIVVSDAADVPVVQDVPDADIGDVVEVSDTVDAEVMPEVVDISDEDVGPVPDAEVGPDGEVETADADVAEVDAAGCEGPPPDATLALECIANLAFDQLCACAGAAQYCLSDGSWYDPENYEFGELGLLEGLPYASFYEQEEQTCDNVDNDCDGEVDEGCGCTEDQVCGPTYLSQEILDSSECQLGVQTCDAGELGPCEGAVNPVDEECDGLDNDCDGIIDGSGAAATGCMVGSWEFDENLADSSGLGHDGTLTGANYTAGVSASSLILNGMEQVEVPDHADLDFGSGFTVSAWVYGNEASVNGGQQNIVSKWGVSNVNFSNVDSWTAFDPGANGVGTDPDGYWGAAFDGKYIYFSPVHNGTANHGEILRYDKNAPFDSADAWSTYDPSVNGVGTDPKGYVGTAFDGKYIYFIPNNNNSYHGEVLRYDTEVTFDSPASWETFNPGANSVGMDPVGFLGASFDGRYVYFTPFNNSMDRDGEVLRYDTTAVFNSSASWLTYDAGENGMGTDPDGFIGSVFAGQNVFFAPYHNGTINHGEVLKYDTLAQFDSLTSWSAYNPGTNGIGTDPNGFRGGAYDGEYLYFAPYRSGSVFMSEVLRYDTKSDFSSSESWNTFDPEFNGGYHGAITDGQYLYFIPHDNTGQGEVVRYDTTADFASSDSWSSFDAKSSGVGSVAGGFAGAIFDGQYIYFAPMYDGTQEHGEVLRYDTTDGGAAYRLSYSQSGQDGAFSSAPFGPTGSIQTTDGTYSVSLNNKIPAGQWNHITLTYDDATTSLDLYLNGTLQQSVYASGTVIDSTVPLVIGGMSQGKTYFKGNIDSVKLYERALNDSEVMDVCMESDPAGIICGN